jgi:hypothetical protein
MAGHHRGFWRGDYDILDSVTNFVPAAANPVGILSAGGYGGFVTLGPPCALSHLAGTGRSNFSHRIYAHPRGFIPSHGCVHRQHSARYPKELGIGRDLRRAVGLLLA